MKALCQTPPAPRTSVPPAKETHPRRRPLPPAAWHKIPAPSALSKQPWRYEEKSLPWFPPRCPSGQTSPFRGSFSHWPLRNRHRCTPAFPSWQPGAHSSSGYPTRSAIAAPLARRTHTPSSHCGECKISPSPSKKPRYKAPPKRERCKSPNCSLFLFLFF